MLNIGLLGTGGGMPMPGRFLSSAILNYEGRKILIDCGEGTQVSMRILKWGFKSIDIICITHIHGDHIFGLPGLLSTIGNSGRTEPMTIIGPIGIENIIKGLMLSINYLPYDINIVEIQEDNLEIQIGSEKIIISTIELAHSVPCLGYSFYIPRKPKFLVEKAELNKVPKGIWKDLQDGKVVHYEGKVYGPNMVLGKDRPGIKLSYITDTRPIAALIDFIKDSNLFICEGTYGDKDDIDKAIMNKHMTFAEAANLAKKANVEELLLTHFSTAMDNPERYLENATNIFPNTILGYDGLVEVLNFPGK